MGSKVVLPTLEADTTPTRTAEDVRALVAGRWATDEDVPWYLYKPLKEILMGPGADDEDYRNLLITTYGAGHTPEDAGVHILTLPKGSVYDDGGMKVNEHGAECAILKILVQIGDSLTGDDLIRAEQADLRIRFLLDWFWRVKRKKSGDSVIPGLTGDGDSSIYLNATHQIQCIWLGFLDNQSVIAKASVYQLQYTRIIV